MACGTECTSGLFNKPHTTEKYETIMQFYQKQNFPSCSGINVAYLTKSGPKTKAGVLQHTLQDQGSKCSLYFSRSNDGYCYFYHNLLNIKQLVGGSYLGSHVTIGAKSDGLYYVHNTEYYLVNQPGKSSIGKRRVCWYKLENVDTLIQDGKQKCESTIVQPMLNTIVQGFLDRPTIMYGKGPSDTPDIKHKQPYTPDAPDPNMRKRPADDGVYDGVYEEGCDIMLMSDTTLDNVLDNVDNTDFFGNYAFAMLIENLQHPMTVLVLKYNKQIGEPQSSPVDICSFNKCRRRELFPSST